MDTVINYICEQVAQKKLSPDNAKVMLKEMRKNGASQGDIAIVGISCRFPGAADVHEYWSNLVGEINCIGDFPKERQKDIEAYFAREGKPDIRYNRGGYLKEIDKFDAGFFQISPKEAMYMEPCQRLFLESSWEVLEDAGYGGKSIYNTRTGIFVGRDHTVESPYKHMAGPDPLLLSGTWSGILASRISYILNLRGPSVVIDTACSSGLVAVHMACRSLKNGECEMAVAGGINIEYKPFKNQDDPMNMIESADGSVRAFDRNASGTIWGEGVGTVFLKPLKVALENGDHIYAVIKGSAINNDGASNGITAPNAEAQTDVIASAWKEADIDPESIAYIETHGTGTVLGDPIEADGLNNAFRKYTSKRQFCGIGSVKTNIGHTVGASGIASLLKVILALNKKILPPSINFAAPNPYISFSDSSVYLNDKLQKWEGGEMPRRAGVSAFGFSGTNCHIVLEEAPESHGLPTSEGKYIFTLSAKNEDVLKELVTRYIEFLGGLSPTEFMDLCYTSNVGRGHYNLRLALIAESTSCMRKSLEHVKTFGLGTYEDKNIFYGKHKIVSEKKEFKEPGEITEALRRQKSRTVKEKLAEVEKPANRGELLLELCRLYTFGADVEWNMLYAQKDVRRLSLPVYPFRRTRYWTAPLNGISGSKAPSVGPLVEELILETASHDTYISRLSSKKHWILDEHRITGVPVVPGTAYIEMAFEACRRYMQNHSVEFRDVLIMSPMAVDDAGIKEAHTVISKEDGHFGFVISTRSAGNGAWIKHSEGKLCAREMDNGQQIRIEEIIERCSTQESASQVELSGAYLKFGPRWDSIKKVYTGEGEVLVELSLPQEFAMDLDNYTLHPALMDCASILASKSIGEGVYLPFAYKSLKVFDSIPSSFYSYVKRTDERKSTESGTFDVLLTDSHGRVLVKIEGYILKKVNERDMNSFMVPEEAEVFYRTVWVPGEIANRGISTVKGTALILKGSGPVNEEITEAVRKAFTDTVEVRHGEVFSQIGENEYVSGTSQQDYQKLLNTLKDKNIKRILYLTDMPSAMSGEYAEYFEKACEEGVYALFNLTKAILAEKLPDLEIMLVTHNSLEVTGRESSILPHGAALIGLGKVIGQEYPKIKCRHIDLDEYTSPDVFIKEMENDDEVYSAAYRTKERYVERIDICDMEKQEPANFKIRESGTYVITGGTGGIGLEVAKYLASGNKVNLFLISRSGMPEREQWPEILASHGDKKLCGKIESIIEIEKNGSRVTVLKADASKKNEIEAALCEARKSGGINGIIHGAGVAGDGFIVRKDITKFREVLAPKVEGTWLIHNLTESDELDFFVLFSSINAITGGAGQSDYTAANLFMDSFGAYRRKNGKKMLTINWSAWKETGIAVVYGVNFDESMFKPLATKEAIEALHKVLSKDIGRVIIGRPNIPQIRKGTNPVSGGGKRQGIETTGRPWEVVLEGKPAGDYSDTQKQVAGIWGEVLGLENINIYDNFYELGGDSIQAIKIANNISKVMSANIDMSDILDKANIEELAGYIDSKLGNKQENAKSEFAVGSTKEKLYELSNQQERIWFLQKLDSGMYAYNLPLKFDLDYSIDYPLLKKVLDTIISRHSALRTVFIEVDGLPGQRVLNNARYDLELIDLSNRENKDEALKELITIDDMHVFDLSKEAVIAKLYKLEENRYTFYLNIHHAIIDGWSVGIITKELFVIYEAYLNGREPELEPVEAEYTDFVCYQKNWLESCEAVEMGKYWENELTAQIPVLNLPLDFERPQMVTYRGSHVKITIDEAQLKSIRELSKKMDSTMHMLFLAAYFLLLHKLTADPEIIIGLPVSGRESREFEKVVGLFMNTVCIKVDFRKVHTFSELLSYLRKKCIQAYKNGRYPFDMIVSKVNPERDISRNPIYSTLFQYFENIPQESEIVSLFDLSLMCREADNRIDIRLEYSSDLFKVETVERIFRYFMDLLHKVQDTPQLLLSEINPFEREKPVPVKETAANQSLHNDKEGRIDLAVSATFTAEPVEDYIRWWCGQFGHNISITFAPYNQVFQQLLDPQSLISGNKGINLLLIRFEDWLRDDSLTGDMQISKLERNFGELVDIIKLKDRNMPYFIAVFPIPGQSKCGKEVHSYMESMNVRFKNALAGMNNVYVIDFRTLSKMYSISKVYDEVRDKAGHLPYTEEFYAAMGTVIARKICALKQQPFKIIVLDCDYTLWKGICGEDGTSGVSTEGPYRELQKFILDRQQEGMLLALCSKNNESDVMRVLDENPNMLLKKQHFAAWRINWQPKSENLKQMAEELNIGLNSFIFIDDSAVECAEVSANCPEVLTLHLPEVPSQIPAFLQHVWAVDKIRVTKEDKSRTEMYIAERRRNELRKPNLSLEDFQKSLGLKLGIYPMEKCHIPRVSQLTQRTNQFNMSTIRRTEEEVEDIVHTAGNQCLIIEAADRFGEYGIAGMVIAKREDKDLFLDTFLLSCRVLGRGVEDAVLSYLGVLCSRQGISCIHAKFCLTEKNKPFEKFLVNRNWKLEEITDQYTNYILHAGDIPKPVDYIEYHEKPVCKSDGTGDGMPAQPRGAYESNVLAAENAAKQEIAITSTDTDVHGGWKIHIGNEEQMLHKPYLLPLRYHTGKMLVSFPINNANTRGEVEDGYMEPAGEIEKRIADIWRMILKVDAISLNDSFFKLGGNSIKAVQVISQLSDMQLEIKDIFRYPTVARLAEYVKARGKKGGFDRSSAQKEDKAESGEGGESPEIKAKTYKNIVISGKKVMDNIEPFNDLLYRDCAYNALFPVLQHYNKSILPYLSNDVVVYTLGDGDDWMQFDAQVVSIKNIEEMLKYTGVTTSSSTSRDDIVQDIKMAVANDNPVIIRSDCFYESIRQDTYLKNHWPHYLLVYGYDEEAQMFDVLEHDEMNSTIYHKKKISFKDIHSCYYGFMDNFNKKGDSPTYFEFYDLHGDGDKKRDTGMETGHAARFVNNVIEMRESIFNGLDLLKGFRDNYEKLVTAQTGTDRSLDSLLFNMNNIINIKRAEQYKVSKLFKEDEILRKTVDSIIYNWFSTRAAVIKQMLSNKSTLHLTGKVVECLDKTIKLEYKYVEDLFTLFLKGKGVFDHV